MSTKSELRDRTSSNQPHLYAVKTQTPGEPLYYCMGKGVYGWGLSFRNAYEKWLLRAQKVT